VTFFGLIFTPVFYVVCREIGERTKAWVKRRSHKAGGDKPLEAQ